MNPYADSGSINTGATAAVMKGKPPTAADGALPEAPTSATPSATFKASGGYEYELMPDGNIRIVKGNGTNDGLIVRPEGKNAKHYAAIAAEIGKQVTSPEQAVLLGNAAAKARAYTPTATKAPPKGPTADLISQGRDIVAANQEAANKSADAAKVDAYARQVAAPTMEDRLPEVGAMVKDAGGAYALTSQMAQSGSERARQAAEVAGKFGPEQTRYLNETYQTLKEHTALADDEAYSRAVSAASRYTPPAPPSEPAKTNANFGPVARR